MGLIRIGPLVLDLDDVRAIVDRSDPSGGGSVEVTFRDGSKMDLGGEHAEALRRYLTGLPDGLPLENLPDAALPARRRDAEPVLKREQA